MPQNLYRRETTRRLDDHAIQNLGFSAEELMRRAGESLFGFARKNFADAQRWLVLCGPGNNAGDGYVVAFLAQEAGLNVSVLAMREIENLEGAAAHWAEQYAAAGGAVHPYEGPESLPDCDLLIDALLGTGLSEPLREPYEDLAEAVNAKNVKVLAADIPTGLDADTGQVLGAAIRAVATVTFIAAKPGLFTAEGPDHAGRVQLADLDPALGDQTAIQADALRFTDADLSARFHSRPQNSHKGDFGHVWIVGGAPGMSGAVLLAGLGALRAGAGKVSIATHPDHAGALLTYRPELMIQAAPDGESLQRLTENADALVLGPGLGQTDWSVDLLEAALSSGHAMIIDADALNLLASRDEPVSLEGAIITPHPGEAGRLLGISSQQVQQDRFQAAQSLAERFSCTVILKGCGTVIADPGHRPAVIEAGHPAMASGGMGDVLSGVTGALLGSSTHENCFDTAVTAALWHAAAGNRAADDTGPAGILAAEVADRLPEIRKLHL